jgi:hypothetical protein
MPLSFRLTPRCPPCGKGRKKAEGEKAKLRRNLSSALVSDGLDTGRAAALHTDSLTPLVMPTPKFAIRKMNIASFSTVPVPFFSPTKNKSYTLAERVMCVN